MQFTTRVTASARDREFLHQFGIKKDIQIKLYKLKFYTFKGVAGKKIVSERKHFVPKLDGLLNNQINPANCLKKNKRFKCSQCSYIGKYPSSLKSHSIKHLVMKPTPFRCEQCEYSAEKKSNLVRHKRTHTESKSFKCVLCRREWFTQNELNCHICTHTGEQFYECQFCEKQFLKDGYKQRHEKTCKINPKHKEWIENQKKFKCNVCSYTVISKYRLQVHSKTHTDELKVDCKLCSSKFKTLLNLRQHIVRHTGEKPFPCQFCKRAFALKGNMNFHEKMCKLNPKYSDEKYVELLKTFKCPQCSYSCRSKSKLNTHSKIHSGEKIFACPLCVHKSRWRTHLNVHLMTHTKEKPFKCPHCDYASGLQGTLKNHVNARHYEGVRQKNFSCEICTRSYFTKGTLARHVLKHTEERSQA